MMHSVGETSFELYHCVIVSDVQFILMCKLTDASLTTECETSAYVSESITLPVSKRSQHMIKNKEQNHSLFKHYRQTFS